MLIFYPSKKKFFSRWIFNKLTETKGVAFLHLTGYKFICKTGAVFILLFFSLWSHLLWAQPATPATASERLEKEKASFREYVNSVSLDTNILNRLHRFIGSEADSMHKSVMTDSSLQDKIKEKAILSLMFFIQELCQNLSLQKFEIYDIPGALDSYKLFLAAFLYHKPYEHLLKPISARRSQLLAAAFWQFNENAYLKDIAIFKRVISAPDYILQFLEKNPRFRFADSLLLIAMDYNPLKIVSLLKQNESGLQEIIHKNKNIYLQNVVSLSKNQHVSELLPFIMALAENKMTTAGILETRRNASGYFQLLVNTLKEYKSMQTDTSFSFLNPLRNAIKEKALSFYVNQINQLHGSEDNIRYASVKNMRMEDYYYIITSCEDELYTSSYLGLYKKLMEHFSTPSADSLFGIVQYDNFYPFIRMAANYNTLADFLSCMPQETAVVILKRFMSGIESDTNTGLEKAMDIADSFDGFNTVPGISMLLQNELKSNFERCQTSQSYLGIRLYSILLKVFDLVNEKGPGQREWATLANPEILKYKSLLNKYGEIIQLILFYGDEDGIASFNNFLSLFKDREDWVITENELWVTIRFISDYPIYIYANRPLDTEKEMDLLTQDSLCAFLKHRQAYPVILIHRGHSYHLPLTLKRLEPTVKLTVLGSCGGYNSLLSIADISADAQIIVSKKMGSKFINDPLIDVINETLQQRKDIVWKDVWEKMKTRFRKDEFALNLFNEYVPPSKNVRLFVYKLFYYNR